MNTIDVKNVNVVLVEPTNKERMTPDFIRGNTLEPYAIECLGAFLIEKGFQNVRMLQQYELNEEQFVQEIINSSPRFVGFSVRAFNYDNAVNLSRKIKQRLKDVLIIFGGYHPTLNVEETLQNDCVDFVVFGEGEGTLHELILEVSGSQELSKVAGLAYKEDSQIKKNAPRNRIVDLDTLPDPARIESYLLRSRQWNLSYPTAAKQKAVAQVSYSRGCQFNCSFCVSPRLWCKDTNSVLSGAITFRSVDRVIEEIKHLKNKYGTNFIYFNDLTFNASEDRVKKLCDAIISSGLHNPDLDSDIDADTKNNIHWFCLAKVGISKETAELMAKAGCSKIGFGIESFHKEGQKEMRKPYSGITDIWETLENTDRVGIINRAFIILGWPHETLDTLTATQQGILSTKTDQIRVTYFTPFPGTDYYNECKEKGLLVETDYSKFDGNYPTIKCDNLTVEQLKNSRLNLIKGFYTDPAYIDRCRDKVRRFPRLKESYYGFAEEIFKLSEGAVDLKNLF